ncbi:MAG: 23S rRNA (pseudouridine(1915)-N(3))-methyltransferase RlmH [Candidatus Woesearchaeota archaeon]
MRLIVTKFKNDHVREGFLEYEKRISRFMKLDVVEIKEGDPKTEAERTLKSIGDETVVLVDVAGKEYTSEGFAEFIKNLDQKTTFVIGGAYGFHESLLERADYRVSLSKMTFPHQLVRLLFMEQLYRAFTINKNMPYHK